MTHEVVTDCDSYIREITSSNIGPVSQVDIFGPTGTLLNVSNNIQPQITDSFSLVQNDGYHTLVAIIFIMFCYTIYNFRGSIMLLFKILFKGVSVEKTYQDQPLLFRHFLNICPILWLLVLSGFIIKLTDVNGMAGEYTRQLPMWAVNTLPIAMLLLAILVSLYKIGVTWIMAWLTQTESLFEKHKYMSKTLLSSCCIIITPMFLLLALNTGHVTNILIYSSLSVSVALFLVYLTKSYLLFMERNIFIVQWILYLCAVELFPLSLLLLLIMRNI